MPHYFLVLEPVRFHEKLSPPLAEAWRRRDFTPCRALANELLPEARDFMHRFHADSIEPVIADVAAGLAFDRNVWRLLLGEIFLVAALDIPEFQTSPATLLRLLAPERATAANPQREDFSPIEQAHFGTRDLVFGGGFYHPESAGYNDATDVARLADHLEAIDPAHWNVASLEAAPELLTPEDREDELAFVREWFPALRDMYRQARERRQLVICEILNSSS